MTIGPHQARSAYVHIPFCTHRCGYCNFTVVAGRDDLVDRFLAALECELGRAGEPRTMDTIFWGGGTPTFLDRSQLERLVDMTRHWLPLSEGGEWSCEANPLDCTPPKLTLLRGAGVTRLSIGGQSFSDVKLRALERDHSGIELKQALRRARKLFPHISVDLIFAAPGETLEEWKQDIAGSLASGVDHISTYGLTIEKGSAFYGRQLRGMLQAASESLELDMYNYAIDALTSAGMEHYEVSSFANPSARCRHNETYWTGAPWLAFGPGAAGYDGRMRTVNHRSLLAYLRRIESDQSPIAESEELDEQQQVRERFVFGMRRLEGVDLSSLVSSTLGDPEALFQPHLDRAVAAGWFQREGNRVRLTHAGLVLSDALWPQFLDSTY